MSSSSPEFSEFCTPDEGLDYVFAKLAAIYGAAFFRHWDGAEPTLVRSTWQEILGRFLTYRPSMDYAMAHLDSVFPPSALAFRDLCQRGPAIPVPGQKQLEQAQRKVDPAAKQRALQALRALQAKLAGSRA